MFLESNLDQKINFMQVGLFAKKVGMTQIFDESGTILPVTILKTGVCQVSQVKTVITDGYNAIQIAYNQKKLETKSLILRNAVILGPQK